VIPLTDKAKVVLLSCWLYSNRNQLDGRLTPTDVRRIAADADLPESQIADVFATLEHAGVLANHDGDMEVLGLHDYNLRRDEREARQRKNQAAVSAFREHKNKGQEQETNTSTSTNTRVSAYVTPYKVEGWESGDPLTPEEHAQHMRLTGVRAEHG